MPREPGTTNPYDAATAPSLESSPEKDERIEELENDLLLMMRSRKALYDGMGRVLGICGHYTDCQERCGDYPLHKAMEDVMEASQESFVAHMRIMEGADQAPLESSEQLRRARDEVVEAARGWYEQGPDATPETIGAAEYRLENAIRALDAAGHEEGTEG